MSDDLYLTRLRWYNGTGVAKTCGRTIMLTAPPDLGFKYVSLDFSPGVCSQVNPEPWSSARELYAYESAACVAYLEDLVAPPEPAGDL